MTDLIRTTTAHVIRQLYNPESPNKAALASLRNTTSLADPGALAIWPIIFSEIDPKYLSDDGTPTTGEIAIFTAVRLFAIHQQGNDTIVYAPAVKDRKDAGLPFFTALRKMRAAADSSVSLDRRVRQLLAVTNIAAVTNSLTSLLEIYKSTKAKATIDYGLLAGDLYTFQQSYEQANQIRLRWGQAYYQPEQTTERID